MSYLMSDLSSRRRFRLHFEKESKDDVEKGKKLAREKALKPVSEKELEIGMDDIYPPEKGGLFSMNGGFSGSDRRARQADGAGSLPAAR